MQPTRHVLAALGLTLLALGILPAAAAQDDDGDDFRLYAKARLGDPATDPPYMLELWTTHRGERIQEGDPPDFRFHLTWRGNGTAVAPGPPLRLFAALCAPPDDPVVGPCDPETEAFTESAHRLRDDADTIDDGRYTWEPQSGEAFTRDGEWRLTVNLADDPQNNTAVFRIRTIETASDAPEFLVTLFARLFGAEGGLLSHILALVFWILFFILVGRLLALSARRTVLAPSRVDPTVGRLMIRLFVAVWVIIGVAWSLWVVWRVNFWAGLTTLGLLSVALGFGMQNTVANLMGGINLAADKPFVVGDRIQVGESWGDVEEIGLRSTKIVTPRKETVIIPNKLLDEREIWNYTHGHQELRLDIDVGISYDSDRRLAEALMIQAACDHPEVLAYPRPRVLLQGFSDFSVQLQLRCWLSYAKDARPVASDIRKRIKDRFDEFGVEIPFPYRTLVDKEDLPLPRRATTEELDALRPSDVRLPRMLYATSGPQHLRAVAEFVARIGSQLEMSLVVVYVTPPGVRVGRSERFRVFTAFQDAAQHSGIPLRTLHRVGPVVETIKQAIKDEEIDLVAMGAHRHAILPTPRHVADVTKEIRRDVQVPVLIVPRSLEIGDRTLRHYRHLVEERHAAKERRRAGIVGEEEAQPATREDQELGVEDDSEDENGEDDTVENNAEKEEEKKGSSD